MRKTSTEALMAEAVRDLVESPKFRSKLKKLPHATLVALGLKAIEPNASVDEACRWLDKQGESFDKNAARRFVDRLLDAYVARRTRDPRPDLWVFSIADVARRLSTDEAVIEQAIHAKQLKAITINGELCVPASSIERFLEKAK